MGLSTEMIVLWGSINEVQLLRLKIPIISCSECLFFYRLRFTLLGIIAVDTLNQLNVVINPPAQSILLTALRAACTRDKTFLGFHFCSFSRLMLRGYYFQ